jgi:pimeloyl-ACP methyl ester carboxylesterase
VVAGLAEREVPAIVVGLPFEGFEADVGAARAAIAGAGEGAIVVGHSYGGAVVSAAASGLGTVRHLVFLCAFMLAEDEDAATLTAAYPMPLLEHLQLVDGRSVVEPAGAAEVFYGDCSPADVAAALAELRSMPPPGALTHERPAWRDVPSTYVVCTEDGAIVPALQRHMARHAANVVEWPTSHSPFFSQPQRIVDLLTGLARR